MWGVVLPILEQAAEWAWTNRALIIADVQKYGPTAVKLVQEYGPLVEKYEPIVASAVANGGKLGSVVLKLAFNEFLIANQFTPQDPRFNRGMEH